MRPKTRAHKLREARRLIKRYYDFLKSGIADFKDELILIDEISNLKIEVEYLESLSDDELGTEIQETQIEIESEINFNVNPKPRDLRLIANENYG